MKSHRISNGIIEIGVREQGAELFSIQKNNTEYLWQGGPTFWSGQSPILFPIVGGLKNNTYRYQGATYKMAKHGFFRKSHIALTEKTEKSLTFVLAENENTLKVYPFYFQLTVVFELKNNRLIVHHEVKNTGARPLYFALGGHPAFYCNSKDKTASYENSYLKFENAPPTHTQLVDMETGLITNEFEEVKTIGQTIPLNANSFQRDALIFYKPTAQKVTLGNWQDGDLLTVHYKDFPYIAFWSPKAAPFVCVEPWTGIGDLVNTNQDFTQKAGIVALQASEIRTYQYDIELL